MYSHDLRSHDGHSCDCCTAVPELTSVSGNGKWRERSQRIASTAGFIVPPHRPGGQGQTWVDYFCYLSASRTMNDSLASVEGGGHLSQTARQLCQQKGPDNGDVTAMVDC